MTRVQFDALTVYDDLAAALAGATPGDQFLLADTYDKNGIVSGVNSQQGRGVGDPDANRVNFFTRLAQEKCCGTYGTMTTPHSASFGLDMVYPGPYPGLGRKGYAISHIVLS